MFYVKKIFIFVLFWAATVTVAGAGQWLVHERTFEYEHEDGMEFFLECRSHGGVVIIRGDFPVADYVEVVFRHHGSLHREKWEFLTQNMIVTETPHSRFGDFFFGSMHDSGRKFLVADKEYTIPDPDINTWVDSWSVKNDECM